ncbi:pyruvate kinase alpha/beta domain-containing protein, partial [Acinetobacter baumannii]
RQNEAKMRSTHTEAVAHAAVDMAQAIGAKAIVTTSTSGTTPRLVSKYKPGVPILTLCWNPRVHPQMSLVWGVESVYGDI